MNNLFKVVGITIFSFLALIFIISLFLVRNRMDDINYGSHFQTLGREMVFDVTPKNDNLDIVIFTFKNPGLVNNQNFVFKIKDESGVIREIDFKGANVGDPGDIRMQFDPISGSKNKKLTFDLYATDYSDPISINVNDGGTPAYRTYYRSSNISQVIMRISVFWQKAFTNNTIFFAAWGIALLTILWVGQKY